METFCGRCGQPVEDGPHEECARFLVLEPPRYCPACRRRMKVQVSPMGWSARCSEHGETTQASDQASDQGSDQGSTSAP